MTSFFEGLTLGAGVAISRYFGAGDDARVERAIHANIFVNLLSGIFLTIFGVLLTPTILRWMGTDPEVLPDAISYFRYYFTGVLAVMLYNACKSVMNALGDSKRPLYYLLLSSAVNIALDILFIGGFGWGVWLSLIHILLTTPVFAVCIHTANRKTGRGFRRSRIPPRRAHDTLQPQDESIIVGYYTSAEVLPRKLPRPAQSEIRR